MSAVLLVPLRIGDRSEQREDSISNGGVTIMNNLDIFFTIRTYPGMQDKLMAVV